MSATLILALIGLITPIIGFLIKWYWQRQDEKAKQALAAALKYKEEQAQKEAWQEKEKSINESIDAQKKAGDAWLEK